MGRWTGTGEHSEELRVKPPKSLKGRDERRVFREVVATMPSDFFRICHVELLCDFARTIIMHRDETDPLSFDRLSKLKINQMRQLRLTPQSQYRQEVAATRAEGAHRAATGEKPTTSGGLKAPTLQ